MILSVFSPGTDELHSMVAWFLSCSTGLFGEETSASAIIPSFLKYFATYDFLAVQPREKSEYERMMAELDNRLASRMKNMPITLVDLAQGKSRRPSVQDNQASFDNDYRDRMTSVKQGMTVFYGAQPEMF